MMKKILCISIVAVICFLSVGCGVMLTDEQNVACAETDEYFRDFANEFDLNFSKEITKKDGKILYIATLNIEGGFSEGVADEIRNSIVPLFKKKLNKQDIYLVVYLNNSGKVEYRIIDSKLPSDFLN
ncbi:MAG: hypothetical protein Q4G23_00810 [Clostridia bacterium]|nr:hypothetical protein [Clostridia bacterium]